MKILVSKKDVLGAPDIRDAKVVEPMEREELRNFLAESIDFAMNERNLKTSSAVARVIIADMITAGVIVIQPETS